MRSRIRPGDAITTCTVEKNQIQFITAHRFAINSTDHSSRFLKTVGEFFFLENHGEKIGKWTTNAPVCCRRIMSSFKSVPPVETITFTPRCFPRAMQIAEVCKASSLWNEKAVRRPITLHFSFRHGTIHLPSRNNDQSWKKNTHQYVDAFYIFLFAFILFFLPIKIFNFTVWIKKPWRGTLNGILVRVDLLESRNKVRSGLSRSILRAGQNVGISAADGLRNRLLLDRTRSLQIFKSHKSARGAKKVNINHKSSTLTKPTKVTEKSSTLTKPTKVTEKSSTPTKPTKSSRQIRALTSHPISNIPMRSSRFKPKSSNSEPSVFVTSYNRQKEHTTIKNNQSVHEANKQSSQSVNQSINQGIQFEFIDQAI